MFLTPRLRRGLARDALIGLSVGDAVGNQAFGPQAKVKASGGSPDIWAWTDDTEMACSLVDVLDRHGTVRQDALAWAFAERADPSRSYGTGATVLLDRIREGVDWRDASAGLFKGAGSWGNGAAMRAAPLGAYYADDLGRAAEQAAASAEVTHAHHEGIAGAVAVGVAAAHAAALRDRQVVEPVTGLIEAALVHVNGGEVRRGLERAMRLIDRPAAEAAAELGNGSRISAPDTVPLALWTAATCFSDYEAAIRGCVEAGGDMDTMAAIVGGVIAAHHGTGCIPAAWLGAREPLPGWLAL